MEIFVLPAPAGREICPFSSLCTLRRPRVAAQSDYMRKAENNPTFTLEIERGLLKLP